MFIEDVAVVNLIMTVNISDHYMLDGIRQIIT